MDDLGIQDITVKFERDFYKKNSTEFEDWFVGIAGFAFGSDFQPIRNYGTYGDHKCDGYRESTQTVFQCYAPLDMKERELIEKIDKDFNGVLEHWEGEIKEWIFVHNDEKGLPPNAHKHIRNLRKQHKQIKIELWSKIQLLNMVLTLDETSIKVLYGPILSYNTFNSLVLSDLAPVIDAIEKSEITIELDDVIEPSQNKLDKNEISTAVRGMLKIGRQKLTLVGDFLMKLDSPEKSEEIAESIRKKYNSLKELNLTSERIFHFLQEYVGFDSNNIEATRQAAFWTILAYFFDKCDIYEDPSDVEFKYDTAN